ncbi:MAG TPA: hypothetical protein VN822_09465 [Candidatus Acidoferrales bacterium]|nr:hypothetical protein [Candidatus Acidoferrales bacterium]
MPDEKKPDPFKPQAPSIPGVLPSKEKTKPEPPPPPEFPGAPPKEAAPPRIWIALAAAAAIVTVAGLLYWSRSSSPKPKEPEADATVAAAPMTAVAPKSDRDMPVAPGPVATTDELAKTWSSKRFLFRDPLTSQSVPAMVVRLPRGEYWGFSLREPFGSCELEFVTDLQKLQTEYHFRADHPMVGNPCNHSVYDLLRYGGGATNDELVRGVIVQGTGIRPPMAIEIRTEDAKVLAVRME